MSQESTTLPANVLPDDIVQRTKIDKSTRLPVLFFFTSATAWLLIAGLLALLNAVKMVDAGFLKSQFLSVGRVQPAYINALVYGWAFQAGLGVMIWIMARLCRIELRNPITLVVAGHFWNVGVTIGVAGILGGFGNLQMMMLEFPPVVWPILLVAYSLVIVWMIIMFSARRKGDVYISQWYILAACFSWPWIYLVANSFLNIMKKAGIAGPLIASWYANNIIFLWMVPVGLASAYFMIPKITARPIHSYGLSTLGFWSLFILAPWTGAQALIGGPVPVWLPAIAGAAQILLLISTLAVCINHYQTVKGCHHLVTSSPTLRFTFFGSVGYVVTCVVAAVLCSSTLSRFTSFSFAQDAIQLTGTYMFFSMMMFGAIYFIVPRITGCEWLSGARIRRHFWFNAYACIFLCILTLVAGFSHGAGIDTWDTDFEAPISFSSGYLVGIILAWLAIVIGNTGFAFHLLAMVSNRGRKAGTPTLIHNQSPYDAAEIMITTEGAEA